MDPLAEIHLVSACGLVAAESVLVVAVAVAGVASLFVLGRFRLRSRLVHPRHHYRRSPRPRPPRTNRRLVL